MRSWRSRAVGLVLLAAAGGAAAVWYFGPDDPYAMERRYFKDDAPTNRHVSPDQVPLVYTTHTGDRLDLAQYRGKKAVVLVVVRGLPYPPNPTFCPFCLAQTTGLLAAYDKFAERDAEVVVVFPGPSDRKDEFLKQAEAATRGGTKIPFPVALDPDCATCDRLGIRGDQAKPSTFILDKEGGVAYAYVGESTADRPSVTALLAQLDKLHGK